MLAGVRSADELRGLSAQGEARAVPDLGGDERWKSEWVSEGQDAALSVLLTFDAAADGDREDAFHAVQYEIDVLEEYIARTAPVRRTRPDPGGNTLVQALEEEVERNEKTLQHPLIKEAVRIIEDDLEVLRSTGELTPEALGALRASAKENSVVARIERA
jgi:hypothetical protein